MRANFPVSTLLAATSAIFLSLQGASADPLPSCISQSLDDAIGRWSLSYFVRNIGTGALTQGHISRRTERIDDVTLIHHDASEDEAYVLADVFDADGFTRFDVNEDGGREEVFRVDMVSCEDDEASGHRVIEAMQRFAAGEDGYDRRWEMISNTHGIAVNFYIRRSDSDEAYTWQSFYGLVRDEAANLEDVAMQ